MKNHARILALTLKSLELHRQLLAHLKEYRESIWYADARIPEIEVAIANDEQMLRQLTDDAP